MKRLLDKKSPIFWTFWITVFLIVLLIVLGTVTIASFNKDNAFINGEDFEPTKGLELYIWRHPALTGSGDIYFTLLPGTNRAKTEDEIYDLSAATKDLDQINKTLANYSDTELIISIVERREEISASEEIVNLEELNSIVKQIVFPNKEQNRQMFTTEQRLSEIENEVYKILDIICSSPLSSSNPNDYINEHEQEYNEILEYGHMALPSLSKVLKAKKYDTKENIAYIICEDILIEYLPYNTIMDAELILFTQEAKENMEKWHEGHK